MKKVLLASTILAFSAGVAAAEITVTGDASMGVKYDDRAADELQLHYEIDLNLVAFGESDTGLTFGASIDVDQQIDPATGNPSSNTQTGASDPEVFISGQFGTLTVGGVDPATDDFGIADIGFDGLGLDDIAEQYKNAASAANFRYSYAFGDFQVRLSGHTVDEDYQVAAAYITDTWGVGIGYAELNATGEGTITLQGGASFGAIGVNAMYSDWDGGGEGYGIDVSYDFGDLTVTGGYAGADGNSAGAPTDDGFAIGASYDLGGGASVAGGIGDVAGKTVADFGINMSF